MADALLPVVIFASLVMVVGVLGNSVVCYICRCRLGKSVLNNFVLALAGLDVLGCALCVLWRLRSLETETDSGNPACASSSVSSAPSSSSLRSSSSSLSPVQRYRRICRPLTPHINLRQCRIAIIGAVIIAVLLSWPSLFIFGEKSVTLPGHQEVNNNNNGSTMVVVAQGWECGVKDGMRDSMYPVMYFALLFLIFFLSSAILCALYVRIACRIWRPRKLQTDMTRTKSASLPDCRRLNAVAGGSSSTRSSGGGAVNGTATMPVKLFEELTRSLQLRRKRDAFNIVMIPTPSFRRKKRAAYSRKRTTFIMFLMTLTSVVSYLPYILVSIAYTVASGGLNRDVGKSVAAKAMVELCLKSFLISSAVNPVIYGFCNQRLKKECGKLWQSFSCRPRARETETEETSDTPPNS